MPDEELIGYLFDLLDADERMAVATRVEVDTDFAARLERLRDAALPLLANVAQAREEFPEPRPELALRTIAAVARHVVEHEPRSRDMRPAESAVAAFLQDYATDEPQELDIEVLARAKAARAMPPPSDGPEPRIGSRRFRADVIVAAGIAFLGIGLVFSGIAKARQQQRLYACQNSLRTLHAGLTGYAEADPNGRYPQIGTDTHPTAGTFATTLTERGHLPTGYRPGCPASTNYAPYNYTLGFREPNGSLDGLRRPEKPCHSADEHDLMPIAADFPTASAAPGLGPVSPHTGIMNVLFVGGNVRPTTSPLVGPGGDDIYRNVFGHVAAGANRSDAVLGRSSDRP